MRWIVLLLALVGSTRSFAADVLVTAAQIQGYGVFESSSDQLDALAQASAPARDTVKGVHFTQFTNRIPGRVGVGFGFQYVIESSPRGSPILVTNVVRFPGHGLVQSDGRTYKVSKETRQIRIGYPDFYGFGFDNEKEILPGDWIFEVWIDNNRVLTKKFTVVRVPDDTDPAGALSGPTQ